MRRQLITVRTGRCGFCVVYLQDEHDIKHADIQHGDTIGEPHWTDEKDPTLTRQFDRVIANPPFSQNYSQAGMKLTNRFQYGFAPETGKKADLMFVEHMIASTKDDGIMITVMPHGVLFRGGAEQRIRKGIPKPNPLLRNLLRLRNCVMNTTIFSKSCRSIMTAFCRILSLSNTAIATSSWHLSASQWLTAPATHAIP